MNKIKILKHLIVIIVELLIVCVLLLAISSVNSKKKTSMNADSKQSESQSLDANKKENVIKDEKATTTEVQDIDNLIAAETATVSEPSSDSIFAYPEIDFKPHCVESTKPTNYFASTEVIVDGELLEDKSLYSPSDTIEFGVSEKYTADVDGVITFRGNNFRDNPTYGYAEIKEGSMEAKWSVPTGGVTIGDYSWSGSGWTGQPLIRKWPKELRQHMNMYDSAKNKDDLVEVIYACMDGYVYFMDLYTGEKTRDDLFLGFTFKGAGALDPRGYPIMYLGAGYDSNDGTSRAYIINLLNCEVMYTFGCIDEFSLRGALSFFDSSALVDAETDTLIYPGENGILYLIKLNTKYDEKKGTLSIDPKMTRWRYSGLRSSSEMYWLGMEDSCDIYKGYFFACDNGGNLWCLDLNTMQLVWAQDVLDDSNGSPVLSIEDGHLYLYVSTSFHLGWRSSSTATVPIWKIDAETGEIVWQVDYECNSIEGVSGGVQSTIAVGRGSLDDYIYVTVAMTHGTGGGDFVAIRKKDGTKKFETETAYTWSSPVCVYNSDGSGRVLYATADGVLYSVNGETGEEYSHIVISDGTIEASPAVYKNMLVIGTRSSQILGIELQ